MKPDPADNPDYDLIVQVHDLAESVLVANDKLELALNRIDRTLNQTNDALRAIAAAIAKGPS